MAAAMPPTTNPISVPSSVLGINATACCAAFTIIIEVSSSISVMFIIHSGEIRIIIDSSDAKDSTIL